MAFTWGRQQANAFSSLVAILRDTSLLAHFDPSAAMEVYVSACGHGIGAVFAQQQQGMHRITVEASHFCHFVTECQH